MQSSSVLQEPLKVVVVGPQGSGKSSFIQELVGVAFNQDIKSTNCYEVHIKTYAVDGKDIEVRFWDCSSYHHQSYSTVKKAFYRGSKLAFIVADIS